MYRQKKSPKKFRRAHKVAVILAILAAAGGGLALAQADHSVADIDTAADGTATARTHSTVQAAVNRFEGQQLFVDSSSSAAQQAAAWKTARPADAALMERLAKLPMTRWIGDIEDFTKLHKYFATAKAQNKFAVAVLYNIPERDCGLYSAGGADSEQAYLSFVDSVANAIGDTDAIVIIEPDAVAQMEQKDPQGRSCLTPEKQAQRNSMLRHAVKSLKAKPHTYVYLDAGNSGWGIGAETMANWLHNAGVESADGFSLNVSNFRTTQESAEYGMAISDILQGKHFVIDTSRNGLGPFTNKDRPDYGWCNPPGRALGQYPTFTTGHNRIDAYLYIKIPGESDGTDSDPLKCFNGPDAGTWTPEYALGLLKRWPQQLQPRP
jgi:endoglucanase